MFTTLAGKNSRTFWWRKPSYTKSWRKEYCSEVRGGRRKWSWRWSRWPWWRTWAIWHWRWSWYKRWRVYDVPVRERKDCLVKDLSSAMEPTNYNRWIFITFFKLDVEEGEELGNLLVVITHLYFFFILPYSKCNYSISSVGNKAEDGMQDNLFPHAANCARTRRWRECLDGLEGQGCEKERAKLLLLLKSA